MGHYSNVINDSPICMCWTINHSQVNVTDRRLSFSAANRMNFDSINSIPLSPALIHFPLLLFSQAMATGCFWLSNYHQNLLNHISSPSQQERRHRSLITLACSTVRSLIKGNSLLSAGNVQPGDFHIVSLSRIKYLGFFFLFLFQIF